MKIFLLPNAIKRPTLLLFAILVVNQTQAQKRHWKELINDPSVSYFEAKKAFDDDEKVREKIIKKAERRARWGLISEAKAEAIEEQIEEEEVHFYRYAKFMKKSMDADGKYDHSNTIKEYEKFLAAQPKSNLRIAATPKWNNIGPLDLPTIPVSVGGLNLRGIGRIATIEFHPTNPNIIYAGSAGTTGSFGGIITDVIGGGGVWKSIDAGKTWIPLTDNQKNMNVMDITIDPGNPETVYAIWADGSGVWKSVDGGKNWVNIIIPNNEKPYFGQSQTKSFSEVIVDPKNSQHLVVSSGNGVFITNDGGANWAKSTTADAADTKFNGINDIEVKPGDANIVYAMNLEGFLYKSIDGGKTFTKNTTLTQFAQGSAWRITKIAVSANAPTSVFIAGGNEFDGKFMGIVRSDNEGATFSVIRAYGQALGNGQTQEELRSFIRNFAFSVAPYNENLMAFGAVRLNRSTDGGKTFQYIGQNLHADVTDIKFQPSAQRFLAACDGGLFEIQPNAVTPSQSLALNLNTGMATTQIDHIDVSPLKANTFVIGTQDNGTIKYEDGKWSKIQSGDGLQTRFDPKDPNLIWTNFLFDVIQIWKISGTTPSIVTPPSRPNGRNLNIDAGVLFDFEPISGNIYVSATNTFSRSADGGTTWEVLSRLPEDPKFVSALNFNERFTDFAIAPSDPLIIYAITEKGFGQNDPNAETRIRRSEDGGKTWTNGILGSFGNLTIHPTNPKTLWFTFLGLLLKSTDGAEKFTGVTGNLPQIPKFAMRYHTGTNDGIYVGTAIGVYYKDNSMPNWVLWGEGLPGTLVTDLKIDNQRSKIIAGTYGRGLWEADLAQKNGAVTSIVHTFDKKCAGETGSLNFSIVGKQLAGADTYIAELSDANGSFSNFLNIGKGTSSPMQVTLPSNAIGNGYKIRISHNGEVSEVFSTTFIIQGKAAAALSTATPIITIGNEAKLTLTFTGSAPYNYTLSDGKTGNATQSPIDVVVKPDKTTTYTIQSVNNACGAGTVSGSVVITVQAAPVLSISDAKFNGNTCLGSNVQVGFTQSNFPTNSEYLALLSDNKGDFTKAVELLKTKETLFNVVIPANTAVGSGYKIRIASVSNPDKFAETAAFAVSEKATATLSTTTPSITIGNEAKLTLTFTGSPSFNYLLSDGSKGDVSQNTVDVVIKPDKTTTYSIQTVSNACGAGAVSGSVEIKVETILSVNPINNQNIVTVYPNPTESRLKIDLKSLKTASNPAIIELFDMKGSSVRRIESSESSASLDIEDLGGGVYFLKIKSGKYVSTHKIIKR